ncbi:MAG: hypothetical protein IKH36_01200 [Bacilli bacterium]|nr:hypothetical protein [Bacilli bacterium]
MFNKLKDNINLTRASLCLEKITTGNYKQKVKAYDKLKKIPISKEIGLRIIENSTKEYSDEFKDMNINSMLLLLLFNNFNKDFCDELNNIFDDLEENTKLDLLSYLADSDNIDVILLWKYLVIYRFDTDNNKIPIGKLGNNKENYDILFPDLYSVFKTNNKRYSLIILLNSFINLGVVPIDDLKKNKKDLIKHILMPLEELSKFKLNANDDYMTNKEYLGLRYVVECTLNIEYYCNNTKTKALLEKLFKHKDNQLKLFVLESFIKKKKKIKSLNLAPIAKDLRSRYLLYNLLSFYGEEKLMPKKYSDEKDIYESELYNIYANTYNYEKEPESIKFFKKIEREDKEYYLYKFKAKKDYSAVVKDFATDYILKNNHLDKYLEDIEETYIGIAGGREKDDLLTFNPEITKYYEVYDKKKSIDEYLEIFFKKEEVTPEVVDEPTLKTEELEETEKKPSKLRKIFNVNVFYIFQSIVIVILFTILILYINDINVFNLKKGKYKVDNITYKITELSKLTNFNEINGHDIYNGQDEVYYVLVFKKKDVSEYYTFVKTLIENNYKVFYVDSTKEENFFLREPNETGLIITKDRFIKVNNHDFEYYVDGKEFILKELKSESNEVIKQNTIRKIEEENKIEEQQNVENTPNE